MERSCRTGAQALFLGAEGALYLVFLALDLAGRDSTEVKYLSVCLCFGAGLGLFLLRGRRAVPLALALALGADTFLLLRDDHYVLGVLLFCLVQADYAALLLSRDGLRSLLPRGALLLGALAALRGLGVLDALTAASAFSFSQLTANAAQALSQVRLRRPGGGRLAAGLALFWCCDACVGLHNLLSYLPASPLAGLAGPAAFGMWLFYLPAQVLLVLSAWAPTPSEKV